MQSYTEEELAQAFHLMWDNYPEQVRLIRRDHTIVAGNALYLEMGGKTGGKCNEGPPKFHKGCRAMEALKDGKAKSVKHEPGEFESFWIPVAGTEDYYIHYTNGADAAYRRMLEQGFQPPKPQEA